MNSSLCRFLLLVILAGCGAYAVGQTPDPIAPCVVGARAPAIGFWTWAANAHVKVYVRASDFTAEEVPFLLTPLQNWDAAYEASGSGVRFEYQGATPQPMYSSRLRQRICKATGSAAMKPLSG